MNQSKFGILLILISGSLACATEPAKKIIAPNTTLQSNHHFIKEHAAPDYWAISPYYVPQQDGRSCSVASVAMLMNAIKSVTRSDGSPQASVARPLPPPGSGKLISQNSVLKKTDFAAWTKGVGPFGGGVTLDQLGEIVQASLKAYGYPKATVAVYHADATAAFATKLKSLLIENEKSDQDFILSNFLQSEYTADPEGAVGHIAPIAAYDSEADSVLIMDPDREYYEPYWVKTETFIKGMNTVDKGVNKTRGFVWIKL